MIAVSVVAGKLLQMIWRMLRDEEAFDLKKLHVYMVDMPTLTKAGMPTTRKVAVKEKRLGTFMKEHGLDEQSAIGMLNENLTMKSLEGLEYQEVV